jgi:hypothetical protein
MFWSARLGMQRCATTLTSCSLQYDHQFRLTLCETLITASSSSSCSTKTLLSVSLFQCLCSSVFTVYIVCTSTQPATHLRYSRRAIVIWAFSNLMSSSTVNPLTCKNVAHAPDLDIKGIETMSIKGELLPQGIISCPG